MALLTPQTYMNESGSAAGPARGQLRIPLERVIAVHDEIDLPFGEIRAKLGGGVAGHNGLKSLRDGFGSTEFWRVRVGVGRPDSTDPEIVSAHVLGRFSEPEDEVRGLVEAAADETERLLERIAADDALSRSPTTPSPTGSRCCSSTGPRPATRSTPRCSRRCSPTWRAPATTTRRACW